MSQKEAYERKLQSQLDEWAAEIDKLKAQADGAKADAQIEYYKKVEELQSMHETAIEKLNELKSATSDAWEELKANADKTWNSLSDSIKALSSHFK